MPRKLTIDSIRTRGAEKGFVLLHVPETFHSKTKLTWQCSSGHKIEKKFNDIDQGYGCIECSGLAPITVERCITLATERQGVFLGESVGGANIPVPWVCQEGHRFDMRPTHVAQGHWCSVCADNARRVPWATYIEAARARGGTVKVEGGLPDSRRPVQWTCANGHVFARVWSYVNSGHWCPECARTAKHTNTKAEDEVVAFCRSLAPDAMRNVTGLLPSAGLELDVWIPSLRAAIELNGDRWHSRPDAVERDLRKAEECQRVGIRLLQLSYKKQWCRHTRRLGEEAIRQHLIFAVSTKD